MASKTRGKEKTPMVTINTWVPETTYNLLVIRALRLGLGTKGGRSGVGKLMNRTAQELAGHESQMLEDQDAIAAAACS